MDFEKHLKEYETVVIAVDRLHGKRNAVSKHNKKYVAPNVNPEWEKRDIALREMSDIKEEHRQDLIKMYNNKSSSNIKFI